MKADAVTTLFAMRLRRAVARSAVVALCAIGAGSGFAQKPAASAHGASRTIHASPPLVMAVNEGAAEDSDFTAMFFRFDGFARVVERALGEHVVMVPARIRNTLKADLKNRTVDLLISRPNDVPAEAVRDYGYQPVATAKERYKTLFIVVKASPLQAIADVKGRSIVTPDAYSNMWRAANAMLRDAGIDMMQQPVKAMRDQAAIAWSVDNGFYDVGVVNSVSGVGRTWEKKGGRVIAMSREQINMPFIASPALSPQKVARLRAAVLALDSNDAGRAILKSIGVPTGFRETPPEEFFALLKWLGDEVKPAL